ncbi:MAG: 3-methyl-2-oxobutanoate hydroxymethyltransferase [Myxococcales bacterium]|nr:3-methyl-2-oxobutanoate hydroxymethyltransferase [Myxococcales bacterium]
MTSEKITVPALRARKATRARGERIAMVTAYDATFARMMDQAGVDAMLVGDSLGMVIQGQGSTLPVTLDEIIYHSRAVVRGTRRAHVIGDMPFLSYQCALDAALQSAGRLVKEGGVESVKLEGGREIAETIYRMVRMGIPVVGHVGLMPQRVHAMGGFKVQGRNGDDAESILEDAIAVSQAGAFMVVVEGVPAELGARITRSIDVPTIGIGAGVDCDGQVLVSYDLLGLNDTMKPKFVKRYEELFARGVEATKAYVSEVRSAAFPAVEHTFGLQKASAANANANTTTAANNTAPSAPALPSAEADASIPVTEAHAYGPTH